MGKRYISAVALLISLTLQSQTVTVKKGIYTVEYSQKLEQPVSLTYWSTNRPTKVNRGSMDFYKETKYKTSDAADYYNNVYDKGHLAPAATFSDTKENLYETFSYLNCALQDKRLNRYLWKYLEESEREWDDKQNLKVKIDIKFSNEVIPTGSTIPSVFIKHIFFTKDNTYRCWEFPNRSTLPKEKENLPKYEVKHKH